MKNAGKLTYAAAMKLAAGEYLKCETVTGLQLRAGRKGKAFSFYYRAPDGQQRRPKLGNFPTLSIEAAREAAKDVAKNVALGRDPSAEKTVSRSAPTVDDLCDHFLKHHAEKNYGERALDEARRIVRLFIRPELGSDKVGAVSVATCNRLFERIEAGKVLIPDPYKEGERRPCKASPHTARITRAYLSKMFALAEGDSLKWRPRNTNPCQDEETRSFPTRKRRVHIETHEFAAIHIALQKLLDEYPWHVPCIYAALFCGTRVTELATGRWEFLERGEHGFELVLDKHKTGKKTGEPRRIAITAPAEKLMRGLPRDPNGFIFGPVGALKSPRRAIWGVWDKARELSGIRAGVRPQDLRRTFASVARTAGAGLPDIQPLLGHEQASTTEFYAYLFGDKHRELADGTANKMLTLLEGPRNVTERPKIPGHHTAAKLPFARLRRVSGGFSRR